MQNLPMLGSREGTASTTSLKAALFERSASRSQMTSPTGAPVPREGRKPQGRASQGPALSLPSSSYRFLKLEVLKPHIFQLLHYSVPAVGGSFKDL